MRRSSKNTTPKLSAEGQRLVTFAQALVQAGSRVEERAWEHQLDASIIKLLKSNHQDTIDAALDHLSKIELGAFDALMESAEACSESCVVEHDGVQYDVLLVAAPILAWTRFSIASGAVPSDMLTTLSAHLHAHVLAPDTRMAMAPTLFAIDQLPHTHAETYALSHRMALAALKGTPLRQPAHPPETAPFLADTRYLLAAVAAPVGTPLFRWQASAQLSDRDNALADWHAQAMPNVMRLLPGCGIDLLLPEAYYLACREGDKQIRPASIRAAVHYLTHTLNVAAEDLHAIIGGFGADELDGRMEEYRVGFTLGNEPEIIYGIVWPLYGQEDDEESSESEPLLPIAPLAVGGIERRAPIDEIIALLEESGIIHIKRHAELFSMEFCDDCGSPLYPDLEGELVHPEMPEDVPQGNPHLH
ncbi:MAG: DUF2863 family protein [Herminiimonas sp.]|nr:DUF2863 family protein [Herminiimonas sp.]